MKALARDGARDSHHDCSASEVSEVLFGKGTTDTVSLVRRGLSFGVRRGAAGGHS